MATNIPQSIEGITALILKAKHEEPHNYKKIQKLQQDLDKLLKGE